MSSTSAFSKTDLLYEISFNRNFVATRSPRVSVKTLVEQGETEHLLHNQTTGQYFDLDAGSKAVWDLIDGNKTLEEIINEAQALGKVEGPDDVVETMQFFADSGALMAKEDLVRKKRVRMVSPFEVQAVIVKDSEALLRLTYRMIRAVMKTSVFWASMGIAIIGVAIFSPRFNSSLSEIRNFRILGSNVVGFLIFQFVFLAPVILVHELAHGVALVHYGGKAGEIGTGLFYFGPMFYVDSTDSWSLSKRQRIMVMWAGNLSTLLIGSSIALSRFLIAYPPAVGLILDMSAFWCFYITLWNLAPPFETDGYYILTDLVNKPDLKGDSFAYLKSLIRRLFHRKTAEEDEELTQRDRLVFLGYAAFSFSFIAYLVIQTSTVITILAGDAASWARNIFQSASSGTSLPLVSYLVGVISVFYFLMTVSGYGVLVATRVRNTLAGTLPFEAVNDRNMLVSLYLPPKISSFRQENLEKKIRSKCREITSHYALVREGPLLHSSLAMGEASLPLSQLTTYLRRIEDKFHQLYQDFLRSTLKEYPLFAVEGQRIPELLYEMAGNTSPGIRSEAKGVLRESLMRQERNSLNFLSSTFATAWTIEIPPDLKHEVLENVMSTLLVRDLTMTNLAGESEEFKKKIIYGLDSIAELASSFYKEGREASTHPEGFQLITSFEPIRGRIVFVGRTETIEKNLGELGSLFIIQVWTGYLDNLLAETNLTLFSIVKSLPLTSIDYSTLSDGEIRAIDRYSSSLYHLLGRVSDTVSETPRQIGDCRKKLEELRNLFQPDESSGPALFESILSLNHENIDSIPSRIQELVNMSKEAQEWNKTLKETASEEVKKRTENYAARKRKILRTYAAAGSLSAALAIAGLLSPTSLLALLMIGTAASITGVFLATLFLLRRSTLKVPRYPSAKFNQILMPSYALMQTLHSLVTGATLVDPSEIIEKNKDKKEVIDKASRRETSLSAS